MVDLKQTGAGFSDLRITTDTGRVVLSGDDVAVLIGYLAEDVVYGEWLRPVT